MHIKFNCNARDSNMEKEKGKEILMRSIQVICRLATVVYNDHVI